MTQAYDVRVKIISQKGHCSAGHKVGEEWVIAGKTPEGICLAAFNGLIPNLRALRFGGTFPFGTDPDTCTVACSDSRNPVVFELTRVRK